MTAGGLDGEASLPHELLSCIDGLYGYAFSLARNRSDAEDLVQETYMRATVAAARLRPEANMKAWLFTILRNLWLNQLKRSRKTVYVEYTDMNSFESNAALQSRHDPHFLFAQKAECEEVRRAIQRLPVNHREILLLREYQELSYEQIAKVLECPIGTVMSRLGRARAKLGTLLREARRTQICGTQGRFSGILQRRSA